MVVTVITIRCKTFAAHPLQVTNKNHLSCYQWLFLLKTVVEKAKDFRADKIVFNEKGLQTNEEPSEKNPSRSNVPGDTPITPKDFYWDQILFYLVSGILGLHEFPRYIGGILQRVYHTMLCS